MSKKQQHITATSSEIFHGHRYLVLWRDTPRSYTDPCPFCSHRHLHTSEDGHRASHCPLGEDKRLTLSDGTTVYAFDGYIVRTRPQPRASMKKR